jgi:hypothetical protein
MQSLVVDRSFRHALRRMDGRRFPIRRARIVAARLFLVRVSFDEKAAPRRSKSHRHGSRAGAKATPSDRASRRMAEAGSEALPKGTSQVLAVLSVASIQRAKAASTRPISGDALQSVRNFRQGSAREQCRRGCGHCALLCIGRRPPPAIALPAF